MSKPSLQQKVEAAAATVPVKQLNELAASFIKEENAMSEAREVAVSKAVLTCRLWLRNCIRLAIAKDLCPHGHFLPWLEKKNINPRTAQRRIATAVHYLPELRNNAASVTLESLDKKVDKIAQTSASQLMQQAGIIQPSPRTSIEEERDEEEKQKILKQTSYSICKARVGEIQQDLFQYKETLKPCDINGIIKELTKVIQELDSWKA